MPDILGALHFERLTICQLQRHYSSLLLDALCLSSRRGDAITAPQGMVAGPGSLLISVRVQGVVCAKGRNGTDISSFPAAGKSCFTTSRAAVK